MAAFEYPTGDYHQPYNGYSLAEYPGNSAWLLHNPVRTPPDYGLHASFQDSPSTMDRFLQDDEQPYPGSGLTNLDFPNGQLLPNLSKPLTKSTVYDQRFAIAQVYPSPSNTCPTSTNVSSDLSRQSTPDSPPHYLDSVYNHCWTPDETANTALGVSHHSSTEPCVALNEIQGYADAQLELIPCEEENYSCAAFGSYAPSEGYPTIQPPIEVDLTRASSYTALNPETNLTTSVPHLRTRRATIKSTSSLRSLAKVTKRPSTARTASMDQGKTLAGQEAITAKRCFACIFNIYGCESAFTSKNEWKRHINTQHMRLCYWRCNQCEDTSIRKPNDFNRKDLFIQHVRRMHAVPTTPTSRKTSAAYKPVKGDTTEQHYNDVARQCYRQAHPPPQQTCCLYCDAEFIGSKKWEERLEHVGRHIDAANNDGEDTQLAWRRDVALEDWLLSEGIIEDTTQGLQLVQA